MDAFTHYEAKEIDEDSLPEYTLEEVARHNSPDDLWIVVYGKVSDMDGFGNGWLKRCRFMMLQNGSTITQVGMIY